MYTCVYVCQSNYLEPIFLISRLQLGCLALMLSRQFSGAQFMYTSWYSHCWASVLAPLCFTDINDYTYHMAILSMCILSLYMPEESCFFIYKEFILFGGVSGIIKTLDWLVYHFMWLFYCKGAPLPGTK